MSGESSTNQTIPGKGANFVKTKASTSNTEHSASDWRLKAETTENEAEDMALKVVNSMAMPELEGFQKLCRTKS